MNQGQETIANEISAPSVVFEDENVRLGKTPDGVYALYLSAKDDFGSPTWVRLTAFAPHEIPGACAAPIKG